MTKAVAKISEYAIMQKGSGDIAEVIQENLGDGETMTVMDLTRVSVPAGGSTTFVIPDIDEASGELETKEIVGIIVAVKTTRQYWPDEYDGGSTPPQCSSDDGTIGIGDPGGLCVDCKFNEFGSHPEGRRKACSEKRLLFISREKDYLPIVVVAPAGSLKNIRVYLTGLIQKRKTIHSVYTALVLEKDKSADGIVFSKIVPRKLGDVEKPDVSKAYAQAIKPFLTKAIREMTQEGV